MLNAREGGGLDQENLFLGIRKNPENPSWRIVTLCRRKEGISQSAMDRHHWERKIEGLKIEISVEKKDKGPQNRNIFLNQILEFT